MYLSQIVKFLVSMYLYPILKCNSLKLVTVFVSRYKISLSQIAKLCCIGIKYCIFGILSKIVNDQFCYIVHLSFAGCAPLKTYQIQFRILQSNPQIFLKRVEPFLSFKNMFCETISWNPSFSKPRHTGPQAQLL